MVWAWLVRQLGPGLARVAAAAGLALLIGFVFWRGMVALDSMEERARSSAIAERDAHWRAETERLNREVLERQIARERAAAAESARLAAEADTLRSTIADLEKKNAALPNGDRECLDDARRRLLVK